jgi:hypothetical protein
MVAINSLNERQLRSLGYIENTLKESRDLLSNYIKEHNIKTRGITFDELLNIINSLNANIIHTAMTEEKYLHNEYRLLLINIELIYIKRINTPVTDKDNQILFNQYFERCKKLGSLRHKYRQCKNSKNIIKKINGKLTDYIEQITVLEENKYCYNIKSLKSDLENLNIQYKNRTFKEVKEDLTNALENMSKVELRIYLFKGSKSTDLDLSECDLTEIPLGIPNNVKFLDLFYNNITCINIDRLSSSLTDLHIGVNNLTSIPDLRSFKYLKTISANDNPIICINFKGLPKKTNVTSDNLQYI